MTSSKCKEQKYKNDSQNMILRCDIKILQLEKKTLDDVLMQCSWADIQGCSVYFVIHI